MKITLTTRDGEVTLVSARQYYRILNDWEWEGGGVRAAVPCPGIVNFQQLQHNDLDEAWQRFWFGLNQSGDHDKDVKGWNNYANSQAFLTDGYGVDTCRNYIEEADMSLPLPKIETKGCIGNVVCSVGEPVKLWQGWMWVQIETMEITNPPPVGITYKSHPHLIHHANNLTGREDGRGGYIVNPFTHLGGRNTGIPILFPLTSKGPVYYPLHLLEKLPLGDPLPSPYNPPMDEVIKK
jgi:hypothetical protein